MESLSIAPAASKRRLEFAYDYQGRRIWSKITNLDNSTVLSETKFLYDGWNLIAELTSANAVVRTYVWGTDLSGTWQGAGGVGGLLKVNQIATPATACFAAYDGNGNVAGLINAANGAVAATYEYGPFGEVIRATGTMAKANPFRFSTKYQDDETDLVYYGYRYYNASAGRWLSRDFLAEIGGPNPYCFLQNSSIGKQDLLGLIDYVLYTGIRLPSSFGDISGGVRAINPLSPDIILSFVDNMGLPVVETDETRWFEQNPDVAPITERAKQKFQAYLGQKACGLAKGASLPSFVVRPTSQGGRSDADIYQNSMESSLVLGWYEYRLGAFGYTRDAKDCCTVRWKAELTIVDKLGWERERYGPSVTYSFGRYLGGLINWTADRLFGPSREFVRGRIPTSGEADCCKLQQAK